MKKKVVVLMALLFISPNFTVATAAGMAAQRAATTLTNRVMTMLEPQIAELANNAPVPPAAKDELTRQLTDAARRIVNQEIQSAMGGRLPNPAALVNKVVGELRTISQNMAQGLASGSFAGGGGGGVEGSAVIMAPSGTREATAVNYVVPPPPLEQRPFVAIYVAGHSDPNVNKFLAIDMTRALVRTERYREASRYEEFLAVAENESRTQQLTESRTIELARNYGIEQIGITSMTSILGTYAVTAKIVNVETGEIVASAELDNSLASLADIRTAAAGLVSALVGIPQHTPAPIQAATSAPIQQAQPQPQYVAPPVVQHGTSQQVIQVQGNQQTLRGPDGQTVIVNFAPQQQQQVSRASWRKNHWSYLGGSLGGGLGYYLDGYYDYVYSGKKDFIIEAAFFADFPLLEPVFSLETGTIIGNQHYGAYGMVRLGYVSENFELTGDFRSVLGSMSGSFGGTIGFKTGSGMSFFRIHYGGGFLPRGNDGYDDYYDEGTTFSVGYKVGVGRSR